ncbi:MAG: CcmD family protein [Thermoleophilia bacterium]|nr:CcmD family protein [Thermoleophilia bacterium]
MSSGAQFVIAVYAVIWFVLLMYVVLLASRTARLSRELELLARLTGVRDDDDDDVGAP